MAQGVDLFEDIYNMLMCEYLSDIRLPPYQLYAKTILADMDLQPYPLQQLTDMAQYIYGCQDSFPDKEMAAAFFRRYRNAAG